MVATRHRSADRLSDQTYVELVRSLFGTLPPTVIMSVLFAAVAWTAAAFAEDAPLAVLGVGGTVLSVVRVAVVVRSRTGLDAITDRARARSFERRFGLPYLGFALVLGLFGARGMTVAPPPIHMVLAALLVGYAAGVAAGVSLRPWIGGPSMVLAVVPTVVVCLFAGDLFHAMLGVVMGALLVGGLGSMVARYRAEVEKIDMRRAMNGLARTDHLTGLANRLGLSERFDQAVAQRSERCLVAVHCLDLDRFKPVNDRYGHPVGDELLRMVAGRLAGGLRSGDLAARVGGDEFIVLQGDLAHPDEADLMARRIVRALSEPYRVGGHSVEVGVSMGYAVSDCSDALDDMVVRADNALYGIKRAGGGAAGHSDVEIGKAHVRR